MSTINGVTMVTDRTAADTEALAALNRKNWAIMTTAEKNLWNAQKGAYNFADLNRVGAAANYVYAQLVAAGYTVTDYTTLKEDWAGTNVPSNTQLDTYIQSIRALWLVFAGCPYPIPYDIKHGLTTDDANNIEETLVWVLDQIVIVTSYLVNEDGDAITFGGDRIIV